MLRAAHPGPASPPSQNLVDLVASELSSVACKESAALQTFYANTLDHIRRRQRDDAGLYVGLRLGSH